MKIIKISVSQAKFLIFKKNYDILVINDGSTDNSIKICEEFNDGPVYIADIYVDLAFSYKETPEEIINKIDLFFMYSPNK